ncbi:MAG: amidohydrolase family protein, partial [Gemmatimonadetes bacterium]|nr:amidohydrolase family protein [Gemmatimonadota bacterium]
MQHRSFARALLTSGIFLLVAAATACTPSVYDEATLAILDVDVVTLQGEAVLVDHMVVISGDRIIAVEPTDPRRLAPDTRRVQGNGAFVLPGFVDMHVHALSSTEDALQRTFPLLVANGVTTVRDMGSELSILTEVRARLESESGRIAPRLLAAGPLLDGTRKPWYGELPLILETPEEAREQLP